MTKINLSQDFVGQNVLFSEADVLAAFSNQPSDTRRATNGIILVGPTANIGG